jgi:transcriptional regulator with XRE-family HTH domain
VSNQSFPLAKSTLAANVKRLRLQRGRTQEELALSAGIDRTYASQIERGIANPSLGIICQIADELGCSFFDLLNTATTTDEK